jgi:hypothetical protein
MLPDEAFVFSFKNENSASSTETNIDIIASLNCECNNGSKF